jgi:hypothetical protein
VTSLAPLDRPGPPPGRSLVWRTIDAMPVQSQALPAWLDALRDDAPDLVAPYLALEDGAPLGVRREIRRRAGAGSASDLLVQHAAIAAAYAVHLDDLPDEAFGSPGGEEDWTVAEALGHAFDARAGLVTAASLAAQGRFPADARPVVPGVPGPAGASRDELHRRLAASQRMVERAVRSISGHEADPCPLEHPLVGRLRCGEWLLFAGIHDLMHLDQLDSLARRGAARR